MKTHRLGLLAFSVVFLASFAANAQVSADFGGASGGAVRIGSSTTTCDAAAEGAIRYDSAAGQVELCDGVSWASLAPTAGGGWTEVGIVNTTVAYTDGGYTDSGLDIPASAEEIMILSYYLNSAEATMGTTDYAFSAMYTGCTAYDNLGFTGKVCRHFVDYHSSSTIQIATGSASGCYSALQNRDFYKYDSTSGQDCAWVVLYR